jgi:hypothetical protein
MTPGDLAQIITAAIAGLTCFGGFTVFAMNLSRRMAIVETKVDLILSRHK